MNFLRLRSIAFAAVLVAAIANAGPVADRLASFVGKPASAVKAAFGEAALEEPFLLRYSYHQLGDGTKSAFPPHSPTPLDGGTGTPGRFSGVSPPTSNPRQALPCSLRFELDEANMVVATGYNGPGCFEIVFSRTKPE